MDTCFLQGSFLEYNANDVLHECFFLFTSIETSCWTVQNIYQNILQNIDQNIDQNILQNIYQNIYQIYQQNRALPAQQALPCDELFPYSGSVQIGVGAKNMDEAGLPRFT